MKTKSTLSYFTGSLTSLVLGVGAGYWIGSTTGHGLEGAIAGAWVVFVLAVLEISLSFDNAVVNAQVLQGWSKKWRDFFIWVGIPVAVFGMRFYFPLLIVSLAMGFGAFGVFDALQLALNSPDEYAKALFSVKHSVEAFGGAFLAMVAFEFFIDEEKKHHWIPGVEHFLSKLGTYQKAFGMGVVLGALVVVSSFLPGHESAEFLLAGVYGLVTYVGAKFFANVLAGGDEGVASKIVRQGIGGFIYLELLDASFSFDGVIGAFAISDNLFIITIGLGVGAMFVRSMTLFLVDKGTLAEYRFLEHGAFWAIVALAVIMLIRSLVEVPETVTGLIGAALIGLAFVSSVIANRRDRKNGSGSAHAVQPAS